MDFQVVLSAPNPLLYEAFLQTFYAFRSQVIVSKHYFQNIKSYDCLVSPANAFGKMDGGMDGDICEYFGYEIEKKVQTEIVKRYGSFQPVGTSFILETGHAKHSFLAHTPTMFMPEDIRGSLHPYLAFKAMLLTVNQHNRTNKKQIKSVVCPGFGTGVGMMPPEEAAKQMALAYEFVLFSETSNKPMDMYKKEQALIKEI